MPSTLEIDKTFSRLLAKLNQPNRRVWKVNLVDRMTLKFPIDDPAFLNHVCQVDC